MIYKLKQIFFTFGFEGTVEEDLENNKSTLKLRCFDDNSNKEINSQIFENIANAFSLSNPNDVLRYWNYIEITFNKEDLEIVEQRLDNYSRTNWDL